MMFIVYKTTNKLNNRYYIGVHHLDSKTVRKFYLGSGLFLKSAIKKYGKENFVRETLFEFDNLQDALNKEKEILFYDEIPDPQKGRVFYFLEKRLPRSGAVERGIFTHDATGQRPNRHKQSPKDKVRYQRVAVENPGRRKSGQSRRE